MKILRSQAFAVLIAAVALATNGASASPGSAVPASVTQAISKITSKPAYAHSDWGIRVADLSTGRVLIDRLGAKMFVPGSILKTYSVAAVLNAYGPDYRFRTPVHRMGTVDGGVLIGNLSLVASGDFSLGLRDRPNGTLAFNNFPQLDHNYADTGVPGAAILKGSDPLAAIDDLAAQVRAAGIREVRGDVVVDDRLFATYDGWPDGVIAPISVNENVVDITTTPTVSGQRAKVDWRPKTASLTIESRVATVPGGKQTAPLRVEAAGPGVVRISGQIAADSKAALNIWQIRKPADFARTVLIEALQRAGVKVGATPTGSNPLRLLPRRAAYAQSDKVAEHVSPPLSEYVKVILKVSYNRGADLMLCLAAVKSGSRDCTAGLDAALKLIASLGVSKKSTVLFDGAGSDERDRTSPADQVTFLRNVSAFAWGKFIRRGMAVVGVDGTQAQNQVGTPAAGHIQAKDGSRAASTPNDNQGIITAKTSVGYIEAKSGRQLVYAIYVANIAPPLSELFEAFRAADHDVGAIAAALQQGL